MGQFEVRMDIVEQLAEREKEIASEVNSVGSEVTDILAKIVQYDVANSSIRSRIKNNIDDISNCHDCLRKMSTVLYECATEYQQTEQGILHNHENVTEDGEYANNMLEYLSDVFLESNQPLLGIGGGVIGYGVASSVLESASGNIWNMFWDGSLESSDSYSEWSKSSDENYLSVLNLERSSSVRPDYGSYKNKKILGDEDHWNINLKQKQYKDEDLQVNPDKKWYNQAGTILEGKAQSSIEGSVVEGHLGGSNDWAEGSITGKVLTAEAHSSAAIGLYVYTKNEDGTVSKIFSPGVSAEVGASVAVVQVDAQGRIGLGKDKNMLGLYGDVEAEVLSAEVKGKVAANRNEVYAGVSAEANLAKVTATGGISVLGTDVGVTGSLKVGVGAHAEVGITDGKLKVDIGAAVGVGFDVGFEVDIGGTVDAVADVASSAWDGAVGLWNSFFG